MDGASQGLYLFNSRFIHFVVGLGDVSNNHVEFVDFKIFLRLSLSLGVDKLQFLGYSKLAVDCLKLYKPSRDIFLLRLY